LETAFVSYRSFFFGQVLQPGFSSATGRAVHMYMKKTTNASKTIQAIICVSQNRMFYGNNPDTCPRWIQPPNPNSMLTTLIAPLLYNYNEYLTLRSGFLNSQTEINDVSDTS
jgi:hypothetical protein